MPLARRLLAPFALAALAAASQAAAGPPGTWSRAGRTPGSSAFEAGLARTADGVLHVVAPRRDGAKADLWQTRIGPDGRVLGSSPLVTGWSRLSSPDLAPTPDGGLRVLFGGIRSTDPAERNDALNTATAPASGAPWTLQLGRAAQAPDSSRADVGAAAAQDGTVISAWATASGLRYHEGVDPATPDVTVPLSGCCAYDPEIAVDGASGQAYLGWASTAAGESGLLVQAIGPGGPTGPRLYAPGSAAKDRAGAVAPGQRTALAAGIGAGGVYLAYGAGYPVVEAVALWRVGDPSARLRIRAAAAQDVALAAAPEGRLWLAWQRGGRLYVTRTNRTATRVEPVRGLQPPPGTTSIWHVQGNGAAGPLDLVVNADARGGTGFWHQQVLPQLSLAVTLEPQAGGATRYTFRVTDAGDPVANATVHVGTQLLATGVPGTVTLTTGDRPGVATATKPGYAPGTAPLV